VILGEPEMRTNQAHDLLVLDLLGLVDVLSGQRWILLWVHRRQSIDGRQHDAHEMRVVRQSGHRALDRVGDGAVSHQRLVPARQLARVRQLAVDQQVRHLRRAQEMSCTKETPAKLVPLSFIQGTSQIAMCL
jgi:hypothetical protein